MFKFSSSSTSSAAYSFFLIWCNLRVLLHNVSAVTRYSLFRVTNALDVWLTVGYFRQRQDASKSCWHLRAARKRSRRIPRFDQSASTHRKLSTTSAFSIMTVTTLITHQPSFLKPAIIWPCWPSCLVCFAVILNAMNCSISLIQVNCLVHTLGLCDVDLRI